MGGVWGGVSAAQGSILSYSEPDKKYKIKLDEVCPVALGGRV